MSDKKNYKDTLNLPEAGGFPMKANLIQREPEIQKKWEKDGIFQAIREKSAGNDKFVMHDGPPYANGSIHIGHLLNKILKDMVVRSKTMGGHDCFLIPGWDCHGLPIEHKVLKESEDITADAGAVAIRKKCRNYADRFVRKQTKEMKRLGTIADYENPYLTMNPQYEAGALEVFARLVAKKIVSRNLKPVHWSLENKTALAEAELEYHEKTDPSVYVLFPVTDSKQMPDSLCVPEGGTVSLMIWTTTPWTLPANLAAAVSPDAEYGLFEMETEKGVKNLVIVAEKTAGTVFAKSPEIKIKKLGSCTGKDMVCRKIKYKHPFIEREGRVVAALYVGTDEGTGIVHTAPGHGAEDYATGIKEGLDIYCPVLEDGTFDSTVPDWLCGKSIWEGNGLVMEKLRSSGFLFHNEEIVHSYPHDWRGKTPTIFRATEQWFIKIDEPFGESKKTLRQMALRNINDVKFHPERGRKRFVGMIESRPDWCISRQRSWGLAIPAFTDGRGNVLMTEKSILAVAEKIRDKGSGLWFDAEPGQLLEGYDPQKDADAPQWAKDGWKNSSPPDDLKKGSDIFDVWFESGISWHSVIEKGGHEIADLYLEGSDQHRGWFQSSLLTSLGAEEKPPFKQILTHGFIVDAQGKKMSKSAGNALDVETVLKQYGADVCRWWVSSLNYSNDVKADMKIIEAAADEYRTIRNTIRFLLSNLNDFDPETDSVEPMGDEYSINNIALLHLKCASIRITDAYKEFDYKKASGEILSFCDQFLSKHYIGAVRDRLYCDKSDNSVRRRVTQTVIYKIADRIIRLCAPILVHTAEEAYKCLPGKDKDASVHLTDFPLPEKLSEKEELILKDFSIPFTDLIKAINNFSLPLVYFKTHCLQCLEQAKEQNRPSNPLDAGIRINWINWMPEQQIFETFKKFNADEIADLIGISRIQIDNEQANEFKNMPRFEPNLPESVYDLVFKVEGVYDLRSCPKCDRCWKRHKTATQRTDGGTLCDRCADAVGL